MTSDDDCLIERDEQGNEIEIGEEQNDFFPNMLNVNKHYVLSISNTKTLKVWIQVYQRDDFAKS